MAAIFSKSAGNKLAMALAASGNGNDELETAGTLLNMDYLRKKMAGEDFDNAYRQAGTRKLGIEADAGQVELDRLRAAPEYAKLGAANTAGSSVGEIDAFLESLRNPQSAFLPPEDGMGPAAPQNEYARTWDGNRRAQLQRGIGEYLRDLSSTAPNNASTLASSAKAGAEAQREAIGTDAALTGDTDLVTNLRELTHNPAASSESRGQLGTLNGLMDQMNLDPKARQQHLNAFLDKLTSRPEGRQTMLEMLRDAEQAYQQALASGDKAAIASAKWVRESIGFRMKPLDQMISDAIENGKPQPSPNPGAPPAGSPAPAARPGEVSGAVAPAPGAPGAVPPRPASVPSGAKYSPSRKQWRDPAGNLYDERGGRL